jgi:hypothetical protein
MKEKKVAKVLGVSELKNLSIDKFGNILSLINKKNIDPELAKQIMENSPEMFSAIKEYVNKTVPDLLKNIIDTSKEESMQKVEIIGEIQKTLSQSIAKEYIEQDERMFLYDKLIELAKMLQDMDKEDKRFLEKHSAAIVSLATGIVAVGATILISAVGGQDED